MVLFQKCIHLFGPHPTDSKYMEFRPILSGYVWFMCIITLVLVALN